MNFNAISASRLLESKKEEIQSSEDKVQAVVSLMSSSFKHVAVSVCGALVHV